MTKKCDLLRCEIEDEAAPRKVAAREICRTSCLLLCALFKRRRLWASGFLKEADPCFKIVCNVCRGLLCGDAFGLNIEKGLPETRSPDRKPDEPGNARRCLQPMHDPVSLCTASQHNETDGVPSTTPSYFHHLDTIFLAIKPFDLPDISLQPGIMHDLDRLQHQACAK